MFVCLIRHGQSLAQGTAKPERKTERYRDCHCSAKGVRQAYALPDRLTAHGGLAGVELVITSPLTRALTTALLGFRDRPAGVRIVAHPALKELDSGATPMPENCGRALEELRAVGRARFFFPDSPANITGWECLNCHCLNGLL